MAIVSFEYYVSCYAGEPIAEDEFRSASAKAERLVNQITHGRAERFAALPAFQQQALKDAICAQIEYYALYGLEISISGKTADGWTVGKVRVEGGSGSTRTGAQTMVCPSALSTLEQTGLLNPQVETVGEPPRVPYPWGWC